MNQTETLPSELHLTAPPVLPQARSYMFRQQSEFDEYVIKKGNRIRVNLPRLQRSYLTKDSYVTFRVNLEVASIVGDTDSALSLDRAGAMALFDRLEVYDYLGGTLLEQVNNLPALYTIIVDSQKSITEKAGIFSGTEGGEPSHLVGKTTSVARCENAGTGSAIVFSLSSATEVQKAFFTVEYSIPLFSFLGVLSEKWVPLHNGFSIDFFLNDINFAFSSRSDGAAGSGSAVTWGPNQWISNFRYSAQVVELGEEAERMLGSEAFVIPSIQYRHFSNYISGDSFVRQDLNLNVVSLRNVFFSMRPKLYEQLQYLTYGHRLRNYLYNYNLQYGSSYLPEIAGIHSRSLTVPQAKTTGYNYTNTYGVTTGGLEFNKALGYTQSYREASKTTSKFITTSDINWAIDTNLSANYTLDGSLEDNVAWFGNVLNTGGQFFGGINTQLTKKNAISGIDTNGLQVCLNLYFDPDNLSNIKASTLDVWAEYDSFIQVIPGVATTVSF